MSLCMVLIFASELDAHCASASVRRVAVSRARISASIAGRGSSMRTQPLLLAFCATEESRSASITGSSESTSSHGWNGWSGSDVFVMRRVIAPPACCSARFMTPVLSSGTGCAGATSMRGESGELPETGSATAPGSASDACRQRALPDASKVNGISPPSCKNRALRAESETGGRSGSASVDSAAASVARDPESWRSCFDAGLLPLGRRLGQSLCQWGPFHHRQGAHLLLHFSLASGRGRLGSVGLARASLLWSSFPRTAKACVAPGLDSSSRHMLRASASLSTLRAALMVSPRLPTPEFSESLTSSSVDRLSLRRRTALAIFSDSTESGSCAGMGNDRLSRCIV
eukprot:505958-Pleurochrysis_carterae.AAC.2